MKNEMDMINFLRVRISDLTKTSNEFDSTDVYSDKYDLIAELKLRVSHYDDLIIEKIKYNALLKSPRKNKRYIVKTPIAIYSFNIETINFKNKDWVFELLPESTHFYSTNMIYKEVNYINVKEGKILHKF
jgi:hypothetical protein